MPPSRTATKSPTRTRTLRGALAGLVAGALVVAATAGPASAAAVPRGTAKTFSVNTTGTVNFTKPLLTRDWSSGWTSQVSYRVGNKNFLFVHKQGNGHAKVRPLVDNGTVAADEIQAEYWETGWTNVAQVRDANSTKYMLFYNKATGTVKLRNILSSGTVLGGDPNGMTSVGAGFTSVQSFDKYALFVNATTGVALTMRIDVPAGTTAAHMTQVESRAVGTGWSSATTLQTHSSFYVLLMNPTTGKMRTDTLDYATGKAIRTGTQYSVTPGMTMATGFTTLQMYTLPDGSKTPVIKGQYVFLYNKATGKAEVRPLIDNGVPGVSIQTTTIESGWTSAASWTPPTGLNPYLVLIAG